MPRSHIMQARCARGHACKKKKTRMYVHAPHARRASETDSIDGDADADADAEEAASDAVT